jgi:hypothetical protein
VSEVTTETTTEIAPPQRRRGLRNRLGCALLLIPWFIFVMSPCAVLALAINREILISFSDLPGDAWRVWVLQEPNARGLGIATGRNVEVAEGGRCAVVEIRFVLWGGDAEKSGAKPARECTCYARNNDRWRVLSVGAPACAAAGTQLLMP